MEKKVLIVGGNRFVGKLLTKKMCGKYNVTLLNRRGTSPTVKCDVIKSDRKLLRLCNDRFDYVIDMCLYNIYQAEDSINNMRSKYIFISSMAVYKETNIFPLRETSELGYWKLFGEYGKNKADVERYIEEHIERFIILRPSYIIGREDHTKRLDYYYDAVKSGRIDIDGDGNALLSMVSSEDVADFIIKIIDEDDFNRECYNLASDEYISNRGIINIIETTIDKKCEICANSYVGEGFRNENSLISNEKAKKLFKFSNIENVIRSIYV
jgi:nucleoside-diphosphate-sugar epimerase